MGTDHGCGGRVMTGQQFRYGLGGSQRHVAIDTVGGDGGAEGRGEFANSSVSRAMAGQAAARESSQIRPFVPVGAMAGYAGHRAALLKTTAGTKQPQLVAVDVDAVRVGPGGVDDKIIG